jgi:HAD superfamily hydrolase (TIGR01509 family)
MSERLPPGKVPWEIIAEAVTGALPPDVPLGPALGEDAALVTVGGEPWVVAADPISFTASDAGRLAVLVNANDVAVRGGTPRFFLAVVLVAPHEADPARIQALLRQIRTTCEEIGAVLIGGHTEVTPGLSHSLVVGTMMGRITGRTITTGGLRDGDVIGLTRHAGLEGTAILLAEHGPRLRSLAGFPGATLSPEAKQLSVVREALAAAACSGVSALHDVTEGGVGEALHELATASGVAIDVDRDAVPVAPETRFICDRLSLDPLGLIGSGALLVGCTADAGNAVAATLAELDVPISWIGRARTSEAPGSSLPRFARDELLKAGVMSGIRAVIFDMDGTLVDSHYDWPTIRRDLGVTGGSIIDELNGLAEPERRRRWAQMETIEATASEHAAVHEGASELLQLLADHGLVTALVTNNSTVNADRLLDRFGLRFDVVLTRDSGFWKPSGAPLMEAARQLAVPPDHCLGVGDSHYDLMAAREAGFAAVCMLHDGAARHDDEADLSFADIPSFIRYLSVVLD